MSSFLSLPAFGKRETPMSSVVEMAPTVDKFRIPVPSHRHSGPAGPWPFIDLSDEAPDLLDVSSHPVYTSRCDHSKSQQCGSCWMRYPQSFFPNWTYAQQERSRISVIMKRSSNCTIHYVDFSEEGRFLQPRVFEANKDALLSFMKAQRPSGTRLRVLFLDQLTGPVLQMVGTKFNVEPFFWSSSLGWIPSRYQESVAPGEGDHITVIIKFIRSTGSHLQDMIPPMTITSPYFGTDFDIQSPLFLSSNQQRLVPDLLSLHIVRCSRSSTLISYHSSHDHRTTRASVLHERLVATGRSVYWSTIFSKNKDPTFVLLSLLWYAIHSWDESLEYLYQHICSLEAGVMQINDVVLTKELHLVRAHLHHYHSLLEDIRKSVTFVMETKNPSLDDPDQYSKDNFERSSDTLNRECGQLLNEIKRLEHARVMQDCRVQNVMNLGYARVNIHDSRQMKMLTEASLRDSAAMKQVAYLTMLFLPAGFVANIFGMNVGIINPGTKGTILHYLAVAIPLTVLTIWAIAALEYHPQSEDGTKISDIHVPLLPGRRPGQPIYFWKRVGWPVIAAYRLLQHGFRELQNLKQQILVHLGATSQQTTFYIFFSNLRS